MRLGQGNKLTGNLIFANVGGGWVQGGGFGLEDHEDGAFVAGGEGASAASCSPSMKSTVSWRECSLTGQRSSAKCGTMTPIGWLTSAARRVSSSGWRRKKSGKRLSAPGREPPGRNRLRDPSGPVATKPPARVAWRERSGIGNENARAGCVTSRRNGA